MDGKYDGISYNSCVSPQRRQNPRCPPHMVKRSFSLLSEWRETQILKFNTDPNALSFQCPSYRYLFSFHMILVVVMSCGAGNARHGFEISMFYFSKTLFYTHIQRYTAAVGTKCYKLCIWYFYRKLLCQGLPKCTIGKYAIILGRTAASYIKHDFQ